MDIGELVSVGEVMETQGLGPNGGLVYCMELLKVLRRQGISFIVCYCFGYLGVELINFKVPFIVLLIDNDFSRPIFPGCIIK